MSRTEEFCECSKPNSQKFCRVPCGLPRYDGNVNNYILPNKLTTEAGDFEFVGEPTDEELEPVLNPDGTPIILLGYPVMQKKKKNEDKDDG